MTAEQYAYSPSFLPLQIWNFLRTNELRTEMDLLKDKVENMRKRMGLELFDDLNEFGNVVSPSSYSSSATDPCSCTVIVPACPPPTCTPGTAEAETSRGALQPRIYHFWCSASVFYGGFNSPLLSSALHSQHFKRALAVHLQARRSPLNKLKFTAGLNGNEHQLQLGV